MSSNSPATKPIEILFSYAHEDEDLRDRLEKHLSTMKRQNRIICWHDRNIRAGNTWKNEISTHLDTADIILLLISADFLDSEYCNTIEVKRALQRHKKGQARVIPVVLRKADWHDEKFAELQALPRDSKPITRWPDPDEALYDVAQGIKKVDEELEKARKLNP